MRMMAMMVAMVVVVLCPSLVMAQTLRSIPVVLSNLKPVITFTGGYALLNAGYSQTYQSADEVQYIYHNLSHYATTGVGSLFIGVEHGNLCPRYLMQLGLAYSYFGPVSNHGDNTVRVYPTALSSYRYHYHTQSQQLLAAVKLLGSILDYSHPYVFIGLGGAWHDNHDYLARASNAANTNPTPLFKRRMSSDFSYALGFGLDTDMAPHIRFGVGYRFSDLGKSALGKGYMQLNTVNVPVNFTLKSPHVYVNQFIAQLTYVG